MCVLAGACATASACFTLVQHPEMARRNYLRPSRDTPCTNCHTRDELLAFLEPNRSGREKDPWAALNHPWWIDARAAYDTSVVDTTRADAEGGR